MMTKIDERRLDRVFRRLDRLDGRLRALAGELKGISYELVLAQRDLAAALKDEETPNPVTLAAMKEAEDMKVHPEKYKGYASFVEILKDMEVEK